MQISGNGVSASKYLHTYSDIIYMLQLFDCWKEKQKRLKSVLILFVVWTRLQYIIDIINFIVIFFVVAE
jgi:hypothetical protein